MDSHILSQIDEKGFGKVNATIGRLFQCRLVCKGTEIYKDLNSLLYGGTLSSISNSNKELCIIPESKNCQGFKVN